MPSTKKRPCPACVYHKVVRHVKAELRKQGKEVPSWQVRRYVSGHVYPQIKGKYKRPSQLSVREIRQLLHRTQKHFGIDNIHSIEDLSKLGTVDWFAIEEAVWNLPELLTYYQCDAGDMGVTGVLKREKKDHSKHLAQYNEELAPIVENIRDYVAGGSGAYWSPTVMLRPGKKENKNPENYFIYYELFDSNDEPLGSGPEEGQPVRLPRGKTRKKKKVLKEIGKRKKSRKKSLAERKKAKKLLRRHEDELEKKKPKSRKAAPRGASPTQKIKLAQLRTRELNLLQKDFELGLYTKKQYLKEKAQIIKRYE